MTVTDVEREAVRSYLQPVPGTPGYARVRTDTQTFYVGVFGSYYAAQVECTMGAVGVSAAQNIVNDAIAFWKPALVLMPGIAFGKDRRKQSLCDVLIASSIIQYEPQRLSAQWTVRRGAELPAGPTTLDRLRDARGIWTILESPAVHVGPILSGEKLIHEPAFKAALFEDYPTAIGGEMEGAGLASVCIRHKTDWALVKAICDWADGKKNKRHQTAAAETAVRYLSRVFAGSEGFRSLGIPAVNAGAEAARLIANTRSSVIRTAEEAASAIAALLERTNAASIFRDDVRSKLQHAAVELARNALQHGGASLVYVDLGSRELSIRDDGKAFDPLALAQRNRTLGHDAGSYIMATLAADESGELNISYQRNAELDHNIVRIGVDSEAQPGERERCTVGLGWGGSPFEPPAPLPSGFELCSKVFLNADRLWAMSEAWRYIDAILSRLEPDQILVVSCGPDPLMHAFLDEIRHPKLVVETRAG